MKIKTKKKIVNKNIPSSASLTNLPSIPQISGNRLTAADHAIIQNFFQPSSDPLYQGIKTILLNEENKMDVSTGMKYVERIFFELNFNLKTWRKIRRKGPSNPNPDLFTPSSLTSPATQT